MYIVNILAIHDSDDLITLREYRNARLVFEERYSSSQTFPTAFPAQNLADNSQFSFSLLKKGCQPEKLDKSLTKSVLCCRLQS